MDTYSAGVDGSFLGLGFSHHDEAVATTTPSAVDAADSLMKHYLQQCLDYHEEQQHLENQKEEPTAPQFVTAQHPPSPPPVQVSVAAVAEVSSVPATAPSQAAKSLLSNASAQEAIAKARSIVQRFQQQHYSSHEVLPADYRQRREVSLERERKRKHTAMLKNFEYVSRKEEARLKVQLAQLEQTKVLEQQLQQQHAALLTERRAKQASLMATSKAGIGTSRRQALEKSKQRKGHTAQSSSEQSVAVYLSGLPNTMTEESVRALFVSYGSIRRVHMYRNKQTGQLKGDALVVYNARTDTEKQNLLDAVCSQLNGAELPCGSILRVEPANSEYKSQTESINVSSPKRGDVSYYGPACETVTEKPEIHSPQEAKQDGNSGADDEDDDLDDFFDSLA